MRRRGTRIVRLSAAGRRAVPLPMNHPTAAHRRPPPARPTSDGARRPAGAAAASRAGSTGATGERLAESSLQLSGMYCAACAGIIEQALARRRRRASGPRSARRRSAPPCAGTRQRTRPSRLVEAVRARRLRRRARRRRAGARTAPHASTAQALWRLFVAGFCAMQVMMMATPSYVAGPGELAPDLRQLLNWGSWLLALPVLVFSAGPFFSGAWRSLRQRRIGMDVPVALGIAGHLRRQHRRHLRPRRPLRPRGLLRFADDVRQLPARRRASSNCARATARRRRWRARAGAPARDRAGALDADGSVEAVSVQRLRAGRPRARAGGPGLPGRRRAARGRRHAGRRGAAHRRIAAGAPRPAGAARGGRQHQPAARRC